MSQNLDDYKKPSKTYNSKNLNQNLHQKQSHKKKFKLSKNLKLIFILVLLSFPTPSISIGNIETLKYDLDSSPKDLIWCGENNEYAIVLTEMSSVYRSDDKGMHWKKLNDIFTNTGKDELDENENEIGKVSLILQSPADKSLLIFLGTAGINWIGQECGKQISALNHGRRINEFIFHPTERNWGLASAYTLCEDFVNEPCKIYKEVFVTRDLGENWEQIGKYVVDFAWAVVDKKQIEKGVPKERIIMSYEQRAEGDQVLKYWNYKVDTVYSDDFFKTEKLLASKGNKFLITPHYLFIAQVIDQESQDVVLLSSKSTHYEYDLLPIETNQNSNLFMEHAYIFLDTTLHSVFLHMNHFGDFSNYGHVYTSGPKGLKYNLSLKNNIRTIDNQCEFEKVESVEGVYIANVISGKYMKLAKLELEKESSTNKESLGKSSKSKDGKVTKSSKSNKTKKLSYKDYVKTLITFNRGGDWKKMKAPERDSEGQKYDCGDYCFLNLFGASSDYPPFYSVESASGIIIGNGNVGHYLSNEVATFLSRDGGLTWTEIRKGSHIYEIGDHGGLILIADDQKPTNIIQYSWDEGLSWEDLQISDEKIMIKNIVIEPDSISHNFIIYGDRTKGGVKKGVVIGINFGKVYPPCRNSNNPDSNDSDYEKWSPSDGRSGKECLLGHKLIIVRRKREARCVNEETFERSIIRENCECTEDDYQCDIGFERVEPGDPCTKIITTTKNLQSNTKVLVTDNGEKEIIYQAPANCKGTYTISKGYRKIPGDTCEGGVKFDPIVLPCPNSGITKDKVLFGIFLLIVAVVIALILVKIDLSNLKGKAGTFIEKITNLFAKKEKDSYEHVNLDDNNAEANIDNNADNNELFGDDDKIVNPIENKKKEVY